ncbi:MAG: CubicO group peptidase (beta-lactamase class C family) [Myxococcota bacterium]|jgi:CubicO group peptidase (beta-lactamase class C family)/1-acyl-sn-glycerol-3-phosphate acyltransferase
MAEVRSDTPVPPLNRRAIDDLLEIASDHVRLGGLPAASLALAHNGQIIAARTFGAADDSPFVAFSTTKVVTSAAVWLLLQDGRLALTDSVASLVDGLSDDWDGLTVEHLLTHTAGCPTAFMPPDRWRTDRAAEFATWYPEWEPGTRFQYHPTSTMWLLAAAIERVTGQQHDEFIRGSVIAPLGLKNTWFGEIPPEGVVPIRHIGSPDERALTPVELPEFVQNEAWFESFNEPHIQEAGVPSTGLMTTASDLAQFYQALLTGRAADGTEVWTTNTLNEARTVRSGVLRDPMTDRRANRGLGVIVAGSGGRLMRGFGVDCSPTTFGHPGMGGQVAWADPQTGVSFVFLTSGLDRNVMRLGMRMVALSSAAATVFPQPKASGGLISRWASATRSAVDSAHYQHDGEFVESMLPWMERFGRYFDSEVRGMDRVPKGRPVLLVANHSGGMLTPDTTAVMAEWYRVRGLDDQLVGLGFDAAFGIPGFATLMRRFGLVPASRKNAARALRAGRSVLVYPGGAHEVFRPWGDRNNIDFGGHMGFVRLALAEGVDIVPIVGHGGHETTVVLTRGEALGKLLKLDRLRLGHLPILLQFPWGISPAGIPSVPMPAKITVDVGAPISWPDLDADAANDPDVVKRCFEQVTGTMQSTLDRLVSENPKPLMSRLRGFFGGAT